MSFFDKVLYIDGEYADERELLLACFADGLSEAECRAKVADFAASRDEYWDLQHAAEIAAESAWLRAAENVDYSGEPDWAL